MTAQPVEETPVAVEEAPPVAEEPPPVVEEPTPVVEETGLALPDMTAEEATNLTNQIRSKLGDVQSQINELSQLLDEGRERNAHKALGYTSWEEYTRSEFDISRQWSYQLLARADVMKELGGALEDTQVDVTVIPNLTSRDVGVIHKDREQIAETIKERVQGDPEHAAEIITQVVEEAKAAKAPPTTNVEIQGAEVEIVDGEIVDDRAQHLQAEANRLYLMLKNLDKFPDPADLMPYMNDAMWATLGQARIWLMSFTQQIP